MQVYLISSGFQIFEYDLTTVINVVLAIILFVAAIDKLITWVVNRGQSIFTFRRKKIDLEDTVERDHARLDHLEELIKKESAAMKNMLKCQLMDKHDIYINRQPEAYITRHERNVYITTYRLFNDIDKDPTLDQFYKDVLNLPLRD